MKREAHLLALTLDQAEKELDKVNLSIGAYRDETGKPVVLRCVRKAEAIMMKKHPGHEYLPVCYKQPLISLSSIYIHFLFCVLCFRLVVLSHSMLVLV